VRGHVPARSRRFVAPGLLLAGGVCGVLAGAPLVVGLAQAQTAHSVLAHGSGTGGGGLPGPGGSDGVTNVHVTVSASGAGMEISTIEAAATGRKLDLSGRAPSADKGRSIEIESTPAGRSSWQKAVKLVVSSKGRFSGSWTPSTSGQFSLRAELLPRTSADTAAAAAVPHTGNLSVEVFKPSEGTLYGPGFYGNKTYCGQTLTKKTLGVASRTLKCGTKVAINYKDHVIVVPVIDRGPYDTKADWDLTMATGKKIGMTETGSVGTITPAP
jgi:rare lipoprotein A